MLDADALLRSSPPIIANDSEFEAWMDVENARLDGLFFEARDILNENPDWLSDAGPDDSTAKAVRAVLEDPILPNPTIADRVVRLTVACLEEQSRKLEFQELENDVRLRAEGISHDVRRRLMSFADFERNARTGEPNPTNPDNVRVFAKMHDLNFRWNDWYSRQEVSIMGSGQNVGPNWQPLTDSRIGQMMTQSADSQHCFRPSEALFRRTLETMARENVVDPIIDKLNSLHWDGQPRLNEWLSRACGVMSDPYHQAVAANVIGGMIKRARVPGAKHDEVMVLIGPQGTYKSTLCQTLAWKPEYFTDGVAFDGSPQNIIPQLFGRWLIELSEMDGLAARETSFLKRFIAARSDNVTLKYKAYASEHARRCIFVGTTNDDRVLRDATGNRRFLPVKIDRKIDVEWVRENLDQLFAEADHLHSSGCEFLIPEEVVPAAQTAQESARADADFDPYLDAWFAGDDTPVFITPADLATLLRDAIGRSVAANRYGATMKRLGFVEGTKRFGGKVNRVWRRGADVEREARVVPQRDGNNRFVPRTITGLTPPLPGSLAVMAASQTAVSKV